MTAIKICGIKDTRTALAAVKAGADYLGLVFASSPRMVSPNTAKNIAEYLLELKASRSLVGVFVNTPTQEVNRIADYCHLDYVQLSGHESWQHCREINQPIIKAVHISKGLNSTEILDEIALGYQQIPENRLKILLDTGVIARFGGSGEIFDWQIALEISRRYPVIVAGGLTPQNVSRVITLANPWGVDVSTGVETKGEKDPAKIKAFIRAVKSARSTDVTQ